jgi:hypothetical protein
MRTRPRDLFIEKEYTPVGFGAGWAKSSIAERGRMKKRLFTDSGVAPTETLLRRHLGEAMHFYAEVIAASANYPKQWQYNRGNGWILKVHDSRKALYYLIAFEEGIEISLTVRDSERTEFLRSKGLETVRPQLEAGTRYSEGYALRFEIENASDCKSVCAFLTELIKLRSSPREPLLKKGRTDAAGRQSRQSR